MHWESVSSGRGIWPTRAEEDSPMANLVVVDDDAAVRVLVAELLESDGHCVRQAIDGEHAVAVIQGQPPDIVVSDVTMPELNGVELATLLAAETPGTPILLMSGACPAP